MRVLFFSFFAFFIFQFVSAQSPLRVRSDFPPEYAIRKILLGDAQGIEISNIQYSGNMNAQGIFSNASKYYLIKRGLILSTGDVNDAIGPNDRPDKGINFNGPGSALLQPLASSKTYDACELSFDFTVEQDSISFNFVFASEEYPEYVHKGVNDLFAFFIIDLESGEKKNLAIVGEEKKMVNVDNINHTRLKELYIFNGVWDPNDIMKWADDPGLGELSLTYQYDGFTSILTAGTKVVAGKKYRIVFAIADVGDGLYDSAVFLEAGSFRSSNAIASEKIQELKNALQKELDQSAINYRIDNGSLVLSWNVNFDFDQFEITADSSLKVLNEIARVMKLYKGFELDITGHTDNYGTEDYNLNLSTQRAQYAAEKLISHGILDSRISYEGMGDSNPITDNVTARSRLKNRRIEFRFYMP